MIIPDVHKRSSGPERWNNVSKIECLKSDGAGFQAPLSPAAKSRLYSVVLTSLVHAGKSPGDFWPWKTYSDNHKELGGTSGTGCLVKSLIYDSGLTPEG